MTVDLLASRLELEIYVQGNHLNPGYIAEHFPSTPRLVDIAPGRIQGYTTPATRLPESTRSAINPPADLRLPTQGSRVPGSWSVESPLSPGSSMSLCSGDELVEMCDICGHHQVKWICALCDNKQVCSECDIKWHTHPRRNNHTRRHVGTSDTHRGVPPATDNTRQRVPLQASAAVTELSLDAVQRPIASRQDSKMAVISRQDSSNKPASLDSIERQHSGAIQQHSWSHQSSSLQGTQPGLPAKKISVGLDDFQQIIEALKSKTRELIGSADCKKSEVLEMIENTDHVHHSTMMPGKSEPGSQLSANDVNSEKSVVRDNEMTPVKL